MPILWRPQLTTGNDQIDQDHKYLFCIFNCIEMALSSPDQVKHIPLFFKQLLAYTDEHFVREEGIQLEIGYSGYLAHKMEHQRILERLQELNDKVQKIAASEQGLSAEILAEGGLDKHILALARSWIVDHVAKMDTGFLPYMKKNPSNFY
ncbi:bacteriohemerythrin [Chromatium okenii]|jgi:hemerythrin-like metal-binding protein|uniref:Hemerythrin-like domain-containing protein n=1 Tax=Chromatium okenii TaxID=61644 RepID=A0A2S7XQC9_9GAMM|nr:hemerythrin family protein [Chromatium okenii]PQJ95947.1 hypothetical protein CXB77_08755 [Chromatium okenii]